MEEKNLQLDRLVFFCDAVVAIAITLLAFNLKIEDSKIIHFHFSDLFSHWKTIAAFFLSFINIANFWKVHHSIFTRLKKIDDKMLWLNICWLLFIVLLPFTTSLVSKYFFDEPAQFLYSLNILLISVLQNIILRYASLKSIFENKVLFERFQLLLTLDILNSLLGVILSFVNPFCAFAILFTKLPIIIIGIFYFGIKKKRRLKLSNNSTTNN